MFRLYLKREKGLAEVNRAIAEYNRKNAGVNEIVFCKLGKRMSLKKRFSDNVGELYIKLTIPDLISILETLDDWCYEKRTPTALYYKSTWRKGISKSWGSIILNALPSELPSVRVVYDNGSSN